MLLLLLLLKLNPNLFEALTMFAKVLELSVKTQTLLFYHRVHRLETVNLLLGCSRVFLLLHLYCFVVEKLLLLLLYHEVHHFE